MDYKKFMAGGLSGMIETSLMYPLDYTKVKRQEYKQTGRSMKNFYKDITPNGIRSFYTGYIPRVCGVIPMRLAFWGSQDTTKDILKMNNINTPYNFLLVGLSGGFFQSIVDNQVEIMKISRISNIPRKDMYRSLMRFQGFNTTLVRNIGFSMCLSFFCFTGDMEDKSSTEKMRNGAVGGMIGSIVTQPIDYVKTYKHRTNNTRSMMNILMETFRENPKKLYAGGMLRAISNFSTMGIGFVAYDFIKKKI